MQRHTPHSVSVATPQSLDFWAVGNCFGPAEEADWKLLIFPGLTVTHHAIKTVPTDPQEDAFLKRPVRSWNVIENTRKSDIMTEKLSDLMSENAEIL